MSFHLAEIQLPDFEIPEVQVELSDELFDLRNAKLREKISADWIVVWGDREHFANLQYLCNFDPRFEEALLVIDPAGKRTLIVGNEGFMYKPICKGNVDVQLSQVFSLMGQRRNESPSLIDTFKNLGIGNASSVALVGWKTVTPEEEAGQLNTFIPHYILECISQVVPDVSFSEESGVLTNPVDGLRINNEAANIAYLEWGAARASVAMNRIVRASIAGRSELEVVSHMGYAGEPLSAHIMYASGSQELTALRSPSHKKLNRGDAIFSAVGYWGGLSCRAGLLEEEENDFSSGIARNYFSAIAAWYESVRIGADTGEMTDLVVDKLALGGLRPALNPGHLSSSDEWLHTSFSSGNSVKLSSGMALQCDVIPEPLPVGTSLNCEDGIVLADESLRSEIASDYPDLWARFNQRRAFMTDVLGIELDPSVLPISNTPGYYAPLFLAPNKVFVAN